MDQYLEKLEVFYDEKMKYLTKKDKFIKCHDCKNDKVFKESEEELILSCGGDKGNKCGPQIIIKLPKYIYYERKIKQLQNEINDKYNWKALQKYLDVTKEKEEDELKKEKIHEEIKRIEKLFFETNMSLKEEEIQKFYDERIKKSQRCRVILKELNNEDQSKKKELTTEYITLVKEMNKEYEEIQELIKDIHTLLIDQEPEVTILHEEKEYKKEKEEEKTFKVGMKVSWERKGKKRYGIIKEIKGRGGLIEDQKGKQQIKQFKDLLIED